MQTFTFLFTDIEGSTALLGRVGQGVYGRVLADHHAIIRSSGRTRRLVGAGRECRIIVDRQQDADELIGRRRITTRCGGLLKTSPEQSVKEVLMVRTVVQVTEPTADPAQVGQARRVMGRPRR